MDNSATNPKQITAEQLKKLDEQPIEIRAEIIRMMASHALPKHKQKTICDEAALLIQTILLGYVSNVINQQNTDSRKIERFYYLQIHNCIVTSAYLIKEPFSIIRNLDNQLIDEFGEAPAYILAAHYLSSISKNYSFHDPAIEEKSVLYLRNRVSKKCKKVAEKLLSNPDAVSEINTRNTTYYSDVGVWSIVHGYVFPIPIYLILREELGKDTRPYYNYQNDPYFGMPYKDAKLSIENLPNNIDLYGRNSI